MCGRYGQSWTKEQLQLMFLRKTNLEIIDSTKGIDVKAENISPMDDILVVTNRDDEYRLEVMRWGFKLKYTPAPMFNSRIEEVLQGKASDYWQSLLSTKPCLIPMNQYYEWKEIDERVLGKTGKPTKKKKKQPYKFTIDEEMFFGAGYYRIEKEADKEIKACTMLTTVGNNKTRLIHPKDRMPIIVTGKKAILFLTGSLEEKFSVCLPYPDDLMNSYTHEF